MRKHTTLKRAIAAGLLSATLATAAALGLSVGTAAARPIESPNCAAILRAQDSAMYMANVHRDQGDAAGARRWMQDAARASANYRRHCIS